MKLALESTAEIVTLDGVPMRVWRGTSEAGVSVVAYIARVRIGGDDDPSEFDRELIATGTPRIATFS